MTECLYVCVQTWLRLFKQWFTFVIIVVDLFSSE